MGNSLHSNHKQRGVGMVETLVAVFVVALGLTSYLQLTQSNLKNTDSAYFRGQSAILVADIVDRMRVNGSAAINGDYNITYNSATPSAGSQANTDLNSWRTQLGAALPQGNGAINCVTATSVCTVSTRWDDSRALSGSNQQELSMLAVLR